MANFRKFALSGRTPRFGSMASPDFAPTKWTKYFDTANSLVLDGNRFHYYMKGTEGPVLVTVHGGGYSALSWALFAEEVTEKVKCRIFALDLRGHGNTFTTNDADLSLDQLANDVANVVNTVFEAERPPIILLGHSLGGAVVVAAAPHVEHLIGVCVIDVVEGTALDSLSSMQSILRGRPATFRSIGHAIQWGFRGGSTHNIDAAKVSMPGQILCLATGKVGSQIVHDTPDGELHTLNLVQDAGVTKAAPVADVISEDVEEENGADSKPGGKPPLPPSAGSFRTPETAEPRFGWRIDLAKTESFWSGWFKGLSDKFLNIPEPKILLLANIHGLDTRLTVGQMQGRFQLQVLPKSGHAIHEDQPGKVADILGTFIVRQKLAEPIGGFVPLMPGC